jgi:hypothetical protein
LRLSSEVLLNLTFSFFFLFLGFLAIVGVRIFTGIKLFYIYSPYRDLWAALSASRNEVLAWVTFDEEKNTMAFGDFWAPFPFFPFPVLFSLEPI